MCVWENYYKKKLCLYIMYKVWCKIHTRPILTTMANEHLDLEGFRFRSLNINHHFSLISKGKFSRLTEQYEQNDFFFFSFSGFIFCYSPNHLFIFCVFVFVYPNILLRNWKWKEKKKLSHTWNFDLIRISTSSSSSSSV